MSESWQNLPGCSSFQPKTSATVCRHRKVNYPKHSRSAWCHKSERYCIYANSLCRRDSDGSGWSWNFFLGCYRVQCCLWSVHSAQRSFIMMPGWWNGHGAWPPAWRLRVRSRPRWSHHMVSISGALHYIVPHNCIVALARRTPDIIMSLSFVMGLQRALKNVLVQRYLVRSKYEWSLTVHFGKCEPSLKRDVHWVGPTA